MTELDHLLWGAPDLDAAGGAFADATGVEPAGGGSHPGFGTRNNLVSLGAGVYFEVISPDPLQARLGPRAERLMKLPAPRLHTFAVRGADLEAFRDAARRLGLKTGDPVPMSRQRQDGIILRWRVVNVEDDAWGDAIPFMIDWQGSEHPSGTTPAGCRLREFRALHPRAEALSEIYRDLAIPVPVSRSPVAGFLARLDTPKGEVFLV